MQQAIEALALSTIRTDGGTQPRAQVDMMYVADLVQALQDGATLPAIITFCDGTDYWLADGFHRYYASKQLDKDTIASEVRQGTRRDAVLFSVGANATHGLRRTNADKRKAVETLLNDPEWSQWSNREIARRCAVDEITVRRFRDSSSATLSQMEPTERIVERNGTIYTMNAAKIGRIQPQESPSLHVWKELETRPFIVEDEEKNTEVTEEARYMLHADTGTLDYYYDDLRRDAFQRDQERREEATATKSATLTALQSSESNEWYTPAQYVEAARLLMGGIDVDPASCALANQTIQARRFYTKEDNGLMQSWAGRCWLNPPYGVENGVSNQEVWSHQLIERYRAGLVSEAVLLVNANTEAKWFQPLYDYPICFTNHRIRFYNSEGTSSQPTQGNALIYFGKQYRRFIELFSPFGAIVRRADTNDH